MTTNGDGVFCKTDSHWSGLGCTLAAQAIAENARGALPASASRKEYAVEWKELEIKGDLVGLLPREHHPKPGPEKIVVRSVSEKGTGGGPAGPKQPRPAPRRQSHARLPRFSGRARGPARSTGAGVRVRAGLDRHPRLGGDACSHQSLPAQPERIPSIWRKRKSWSGVSRRANSPKQRKAGRRFRWRNNAGRDVSPRRPSNLGVVEKSDALEMRPYLKHP